MCPHSAKTLPTMKTALLAFLFLVVTAAVEARFELRIVANCNLYESMFSKTSTKSILTLKPPARSPWSPKTWKGHTTGPVFGQRRR